MKKENERLSNFELMKVLSMFLILVWHYIHNTGLLNYTSGFLHMLLTLVWFITIIHVNSFVLALGYFQSEKKFRMSRLISLNNASWFYRIMIVIIFCLIGLDIASVEKIQLLSPITLYQQYWFLITYILLYCISPFLNMIIKNITKRDFRRLLIILFIIASVLPTITGQLVYNNQDGHSLLTFVLLYFIGAYLKKYPFKESYIFKVLSKNQGKLIFISIFFLMAILNTFLYHYGEELTVSGNTILQEIGQKIINLKLGFDNPLVIIQTVAYFLYFSFLNIKSKKINFLAKYSFGIYLIHDNPLIRRYLYDEFYSFGFKYQISSVLIRILLSCIIVFVICILIEFIRQKVFSQFSKTKSAQRLREKTKSYFESLNLGFHW